LKWERKKAEGTGVRERKGGKKAESLHVGSRNKGQKK